MADKPEVNKSQAIRDYFKLNPNAKAKEVVDALAKKDITVTIGLVNNVKSTHNKRLAAKRTAKTTARSPASEAKTNGVNKTQAVRDYLKANKKAKAQEVVDALGKQGITITVGYVRTIKAKHNKRQRVVRTAVAKGNIGIPEIKAALVLLKVTGSVAAATEALAAAQEIREIA